ncbi:MAG: TetR/AcrR family transcriptional regulator [bacterium]
MKKTQVSGSPVHMSQTLRQCAFDLFVEHGFDNVNLDQIAAAAGVTKGSLYWHYKNKQELILASCQHYYQTWHANIQKLLAPLSNPHERLKKTIAYSVDSCVIDKRNRVFTTAIFTLMQENDAVRDSWAQFYSTVREFYIGLLYAVKHAESSTSMDHVRRDVDLMLEAMEGLKIRAGFEKQMVDQSERLVISESLLSIFKG